MYIPAKRTPVTALEMLNALSKAAPELSRASLLILLAQSSLETGHWASQWCWNVGNAKSSPGGLGHWTFLPRCDEYLKPHIAASLLAKAKPRTDGQPGLDAVLNGKRQADGDIGVDFFPSNTVDCFRAFTSLEEGVADHLQLLRRRFLSAWKHVESADVEAFCRALGASGYFTAAIESYTKAVVDWVERLDHETYVLAALPKAGFASIVAAQTAIGLKPNGVADRTLRVELAIMIGDVNP